MSDNFKDSIKQNINSNIKNNNDNKVSNKISSGGKFHLTKKKVDKNNKKTFPVYMENDLLKELDKLGKKSGYSRNELINIMCNWCVNNLDFEE
ncbi:ribbon-helix-helix domain-containing protein [Clostridium sp.]|uniref:ribbon-helix-helix domain-containing protein n=1 Tax=Clostridium sp. TaxID=1506 RepID=UPI0035A027C0